MCEEQGPGCGCTPAFLDVLYALIDTMISANESAGKTGADDFTGSLADVTDSGGVFLESTVRD